MSNLNKDRQTELSNWITAYTSNQSAITQSSVNASDVNQQRVSNATVITQLNEEKSYQSGVGSFPNPFNPPGLSNRKP
jgi:hypothetical protein